MIAANDAIWQGKKDKWLFGKNIVATQQLNEQRNKIGLENLDDFYKKAIYKNKMPFFELKMHNSAKELTYASSCEMIETLLRNTIIIE